MSCSIMRVAVGFWRALHEESSNEKKKKVDGLRDPEANEKVQWREELMHIEPIERSRDCLV